MLTRRDIAVLIGLIVLALAAAALQIYGAEQNPKPAPLQAHDIAIRDALNTYIIARQIAPQSPRQIAPQSPRQSPPQSKEACQLLRKVHDWHFIGRARTAAAFGIRNALGARVQLVAISLKGQRGRRLRFIMRQSSKKINGQKNKIWQVQQCAVLRGDFRDI